MVALDQSAQHLALADQMLLSDKFLQALWSEAGRQRLRCSIIKHGCLFHCNLRNCDKSIISKYLAACKRPARPVCTAGLRQTALFVHCIFAYLRV